MSRQITDPLLWKAGMKRIPVYGVFELSPWCNFSCRMCYVRKSMEEIRQAGGLLPTEWWIDLARQAREEGLLYLLITGGEPFAYPGFWEFYETCSKMGFRISINSNGSLLDRRCVERLAKMPPSRMNITLYGASRESYGRLCGMPQAFDRVLEGTRLLDEYGITWLYNCSLTKYNCKELREIIDIVKKQGKQLQLAAYMFPPVRRDGQMVGQNDRLTAREAGYYEAESAYLRMDREMFLEYAAEQMKFWPPPPLEESLKLRETKEMSCRAGRCSFWVDWKGEISACGMTDRKSADLKQTAFREAWKRVVEDTNQIRCLDACAGCPNIHLCHACISSAYCETGDSRGRPVYQCEMAGARAQACRQKVMELQQEIKQSKIKD